jgi:hypothetical protein
MYAILAALKRSGYAIVKVCEDPTQGPSFMSQLET